MELAHAAVRDDDARDRAAVAATAARRADADAGGSRMPRARARRCVRCAPCAVSQPPEQQCVVWLRCALVHRTAQSRGYRLCRLGSGCGVAVLPTLRHSGVSECIGADGLSANEAEQLHALLTAYAPCAMQHATGRAARYCHVDFEYIKRNE